VSYTVRPIEEEDIFQLAEIEKEAFPTTWPPTPFKRELSNKNASLLVVYKLPEVEQPSLSPSQRRLAENCPNSHGVRGLWKRLFQGNDVTSIASDPTNFIAGYVATWYMTDEAHITGIAVRESLRGNGLGELLLMSSIETAMRHQSRVVTLEVRVSNHVAQSLYTKYGFIQVGRRKGYYADNHEDAYIMTTDVISSTAYNQHLHCLHEIYKTRQGDVALGLG
jgi:ribosomal-protein-alanine N-acetyltransferase